MPNKQKYFLSVGDSDIEFEMPDDPREAAELVLHLADEQTGNVLNYPSIHTAEEIEAMDADIDETI